MSNYISRLPSIVHFRDRIITQTPENKSACNLILLDWSHVREPSGKYEGPPILVFSPHHLNREATPENLNGKYYYHGIRHPSKWWGGPKSLRAQLNFPGGPQTCDIMPDIPLIMMDGSAHLIRIAMGRPAKPSAYRCILPLEKTDDAIRWRELGIDGATPHREVAKRLGLSGPRKLDVAAALVRKCLALINPSNAYLTAEDKEFLSLVTYAPNERRADELALDEVVRNAWAGLHAQKEAEIAALKARIAALELPDADDI